MVEWKDEKIKESMKKKTDSRAERKGDETRKSEQNA